VSIFVGNLPFRAEQEDVTELFAQFGEVVNCALPLERDTGRKRGFAFVEMSNDAAEEAAIEGLQGAELMGRPLRINKAEHRRLYKGSSTMVRLTLVASSFLALFPTSSFAARVSREGDLSTDKVDSATLPYAGVDSPVNHDCGSEYTLGGLGSDTLPDLLTHAHEWCNSALVPEEKRVPEAMRGLYWMKGLALSDIAFCGSLGEYDPETFTVRIPVWMGFVVGREPEEEIPQLILDTSGMGSRFSIMGFALGRSPLIYSIQFTNSSLQEAVIVPSARIFNAISRHPMIALPATEDGSLASERPGDIFDRPSFMFGFYHGKYEAVKVMYDDGTLHPERVAAMRAAEMNKNVTYMRYAPTC
jgi:hypothetical protein